MVREDFFDCKDNFYKTEQIKSIAIFESKLDFKPKVTIAIPTYKRTDLLKEAVDSAINQSGFFKYDILVVDNDSERNCATEKLMRSYALPNLSYFKNSENMGMVGNLNRLYTLAKGEYVAELHDDDFLFPDYLSVLTNVLAITKEKYNAIYSSSVEYNMIKSHLIPPRDLNAKIYLLNLKVNDFLWGNVAGSSGHLLKKQTFLDMGGYNSDYYPADDFEFNVKLSHLYNTCLIRGYPLFVYRILKNESAETKTLLGFATKGTAITKNILNLRCNRPYRSLWKRFHNAHVYQMLNNGRILYENEDINVNEELSCLGFRKGKIDFLIYKIMLQWRSILIKLRSKSLDIKQ